MTQPPEPSSQPDGQRRVGNQVLLTIAAVIGLGLFASMMGVSSSPSKDKAAAAHLFVAATMKTVLGRFKIDNGSYPSTAQGLQSLLTPPRRTEKTWDGPYLEITPPDKMPLDPWGHAYCYAYPSLHASTASKSAGASGPTTTRPQYDLWSLGPDGKDGTADDIGNW